MPKRILFEVLGDNVDIIMALEEQGIGVDSLDTLPHILPYPGAEPSETALANKIMTIHYGLITRMDGVELPVPILLILTVSHQYQGRKWDSEAAQGHSTYNQEIIRTLVEHELGQQVLVLDVAVTKDWAVTAYREDLEVVASEVPNHALFILLVDPNDEPNVPVHRAPGCTRSDNALFQQAAIRKLVGGRNVYGVDTPDQVAAIIAMFVKESKLPEDAHWEEA